MRTLRSLATVTPVIHITIVQILIWLLVGCALGRQGCSSWWTGVPLAPLLKSALDRPVPDFSCADAELVEAVAVVLQHDAVVMDGSNSVRMVSLAKTNISAGAVIKILTGNMRAATDPWGRILFFGTDEQVSRAREVARRMKEMNDPALDLEDSVCGDRRHINQWLSVLSERRMSVSRVDCQTQHLEIASSFKDGDGRGIIERFKVTAPQKSMLWALVVLSDADLVLDGNTIRILPSVKPSNGVNSAP